MLTSLIACAVVVSAPTLALRVDGEGYLRFARQGRVSYAKSATLTVSGGRLVGLDGAILMPSVAVPGDAQTLEVSLQGAIFAWNGSSKTEIGGIVLALFPAGTVLSPEDGLLVAAARPTLGRPGDETNGVIRTGGQRVVGAPTKAIAAAPTKALAATPVGIRIAVAPESEADTDTFTLGQIAQISADATTTAKLSAIVIGVTPTLGVTCRLSSLGILSKLRAAQIDTTKISLDVPSGATLGRRAQHVRQQQFVDCAVAYAKSQAQTGVEFACHEPGRDYLAPFGNLELKVEQYTPTPTGASLTVAVVVEGKRLNCRTVRLETTGVGGGPLIRVPAGTKVKVVFRSNGAIVEVPGRTSKASAVGQSVDVLTASRTAHTGILTGPATVEVKL